MPRLAITLTATVALAGSILLATSTAVQADPGRCGVSVEGPSSTGTGFAYFVRNDCSAPINVKVHMYTVDQYTPCKWIEPGETAALLSNYVDQSWQAEGC